MRKSTISTAPIAETVEEFVSGRISNCNKLNIRSSPNLKGAVLEVLNAGTTLKVNKNSRYNKFYEVISPNTGRKGYAMKEFIHLVEEVN